MDLCFPYRWTPDAADATAPVTSSGTVGPVELHESAGFAEWGRTIQYTIASRHIASVGGNAGALVSLQIRAGAETANAMTIIQLLGTTQSPGQLQIDLPDTATGTPAISSARLKLISAPVALEATVAQGQ